MENAAGSSDREMAIVEQSIDYKINALRETWVGTVQELIDSGKLGKLIDALTRISELLGDTMNTLGPVGTLLLGGGSIVGFKNIDKIIEAYA